MVKINGTCKKTGELQDIMIDYIRADDTEEQIKVCTFFNCPIEKRMNCEGKHGCSILDQKGYEH